MFCYLFDPYSPFLLSSSVRICMYEGVDVWLISLLNLCRLQQLRT